MIEILRMVESNRKAMRWSRTKFAEEMGAGMNKEKLDAIFRAGKQGRLPRADTLQRMLNVAELIGYDAKLFGWGQNQRVPEDD